MVMSNLIFSPYSCFLDPAIRLEHSTIVIDQGDVKSHFLSLQMFAGPSNKTLYVENYPITTHSVLLLGVALTDQFLHVSFF